MSWRAAAATALLTLAVGGTAHASIPDGSGLITSCYTTDPAAFGALRVIDVGAAMTCHGGENQLTFNQQGPQGIQGPQGVQGPPGPAGPSGQGTEYIRYGWHSSFTELGHGQYSIAKFATTTLVIPSAGTWVIRAEVSPGPGANVRWCALGLVDGINLPSEINYYLAGYLTYEEWDSGVWVTGGGHSPVPELDVHATLTQPSYAVLRCVPTGFSANGVLNGDEVASDIEAWKVASATDSDGSNLVGQAPNTNLTQATLPALTRGLGSGTTTKLLQISGGGKLTRKLRARIVLLESQGQSPGQISALTGASSKQISTAVRDFNKSGLKSLR